jgi:twinkle protein
MQNHLCFLIDVLCFHITVHSANNYAAASEERLGQLIQKLKNEGINPKQWRLGNFQRMLCPQVCSFCFLQPCAASVYCLF